MAVEGATLSPRIDEIFAAHDRFLDPNTGGKIETHKLAAILAAGALVVGAGGYIVESNGGSGSPNGWKALPLTVILFTTPAPLP